jgi:hypothetical protein
MKRYFIGKIHSPFSVSISCFSTRCQLVITRELQWVNESGMIGTQIGTHNRSEMVAVLGTPCAIPSHYSNSTQMEDDSPKKHIYAEKVLLIQCISHCYYKQT